MSSSEYAAQQLCLAALKFSPRYKSEMGNTLPDIFIHSNMLLFLNVFGRQFRSVGEKGERGICPFRPFPLLWLPYNQKNYLEKLHHESFFKPWMGSDTAMDPPTWLVEIASRRTCLLIQMAWKYSYKAWCGFGGKVVKSLSSSRYSNACFISYWRTSFCTASIFTWH